jgi:hypothetical protein
MEAVRSNKANLRKLEWFGFLIRRRDYSDKAVAVLSPKQGKFAGIGKVRTYPASQSKI